MKHISLFSGQGGNDLAAEWMGWDNIAHCEKNEFCLRILKYYWPNATTHKDIKTTDFTVYQGHADIVTCGFPCQAFSTAGKQLGTEDERYLWPEGFRAIREIKPPFVVVENVTGLISWGNGVVFEQVQSDLESEGFEVIPFVLPAAGIEAPHGRHRIWFIAYSNRNDARRRGYGEVGQAPRHVKIIKEKRQRIRPNIERTGCETIITYADQFHGYISRLRTGEISQHKTSTIFVNTAEHTDKERRIQLNPSDFAAKSGFSSGRCDEIISNTDSIRLERVENTTAREIPIVRTDWSEFPTISPVCSGNDGFSSQLDGITFSSWRNQSIMSAGNSVVPQLVLEIFKAIDKFKKLKHW